MSISVQTLGQTGYRFGFGAAAVFVDPYLSDAVEWLEGADHARLFPVALEPDSISDAHCVCVTHMHADHCDTPTLRKMHRASPRARLIAPAEVASHLRREGISDACVVTASERWMAIASGLRVVAVPAAHPAIQRDEDNNLRCVGYVFEYEGRRVYHAGDTSVTQPLIDRLRELAPFEAAFLPVNERNFFKERRGIIGNMSLREAFQLAEEIGVNTLVPTHWDMFRPNSVFREEIEVLYRKLQPRFTLRIYPEAI